MQKKSRDNLSFVHGRILISAATKAFSGGTAHIFLEDISRADAPRRVVAKIEINNIEHPLKDSGNSATGISFRIDFLDEAYNPKNYYSLRVWIDLNGDEKQSADDLYNDRVYPVLTRGAGNFAEIPLKSQD